MKRRSSRSESAFPRRGGEVILSQERRGRKKKRKTK
jgi:hypothetical protein